MKKSILILLVSVLLFSCSSNDNSNPPTDPPTSPITNKYKISFEGVSNLAIKHFKGTYTFDDGTPQVINYDGNFTTGFTTGNATKSIKLDLEMMSGLCYLKNIKIKIENLLTGQIEYQQSTFNGYIVSPDALTDSDYLTQIYGVPMDIVYGHKLQFGYYFSYANMSGISYDFNQDILVKKSTRSTMKIIVDNQSLGGYSLSVSNAFGGYFPNPQYQFYNNWVGASEVYSDVDRTYHFVMPKPQNSVQVKLWGAKVNATIYIMRKDGTTQTLPISSTSQSIPITSNITL